MHASSGSHEPESNWFQWTPRNNASPAYADIATKVEEFQSIDKQAGHAATRWLKEDALLNHPSTVTYVLVSDHRVEGYFALASSSVTLSQRHRRKLAPGQQDYELAPTQGASLIAWLAKHVDAEVPGERIVLYAIGVALDVAGMQGTPVLVADPYDEESAKLWMDRYDFFRSRTPGGADVRLWIPLHPA